MTLSVKISLFGEGKFSFFLLYIHCELGEIPATDRSQDVMSQLKDYPFRPINNEHSWLWPTISWDPLGAGISVNSECIETDFALELKHMH